MKTLLFFLSLLLLPATSLTRISSNTANQSLCFDGNDGSNIITEKERYNAISSIGSGDDSKGEIGNCFGDHFVTLQGSGSNDHYNGNVTLVSAGLYQNITYYYYQGTEFCSSDSCEEGKIFIFPGNYRLKVKCICNQIHWKNFTIDSSILYSSQDTLFQGDEVINYNQGLFIANNYFTFQSNSPIGHVHSEITFPEIYDGSNNLVSSLSIADAFKLFYCYQTNCRDFDVLDDSEITVTYNYYCHAPYGISPDNNSNMFFAASATETFDCDVVSMPSSLYCTTLFFQLDFFHIRDYIDNSDSYRAIEVMYLTISIDFDVVSKKITSPHQSGEIINIDDFYNVLMETFFYFEFNENVNQNSSWTSQLATAVDVIIESSISSLISTIPYVGPILALSFELVVAYGLVPTVSSIVNYQSPESIIFYSIINYDNNGV